MDRRSDWLLKLLSEERHDLLQVLELKHKVVIAAFKEYLVQEETKSPAAVTVQSQHCSSGKSDLVRLAFPHPSPQPCGVDDWKSRRASEISGSIDTIIDKRKSARMSQRISQRSLSIVSTNNLSKRDILMSFFSMVDSNCNGEITLDEVRAALQKVGQSPAQARRMVADMGALCKVTGGAAHGQIVKDDWMRVVESHEHIGDEICELARRLEQRMVNDSTSEKSRGDLCILSIYSNYRLAWDALCSLCVLYVVIFVPYWIAFDGEGVDELIPSEQRSVIGKVIDLLFLFDIVLNFCTSYQVHGKEVRHWRDVARHYICSWFLIDAVCSIPSSFLDERISTAQQGSIKLFKFVRFFSMLKVLRSAKAIHVLKSSALGECIEDFTIDNKLQGKAKLLSIVVALWFCCHWLGCAMAACGMEFLDGVTLSPGSVYLPSFYWALTTVSTVGYGDILPRTDPERMVAMLAMCVGGVIYGVSTGMMTSTILAYDRVDMERLRRMEVINHWLHRHSFPALLRRRLRSYFKYLLSHEQNNTREEIEILEHLTSDLRSQVALVLVPEEVREVPIFKCVPNTVMGFVVSVLQLVTFQANDVIVRAGEIGSAMFIIMEGHCEKAIHLNPGDEKSTKVIVVNLYVGESFGEEIILSLEEEYKYTVQAKETSDLYLIVENLFVSCMATFPQHVETMRECLRQSMRQEAERDLSSHRVSRRDARLAEV